MFSIFCSISSVIKAHRGFQVIEWIFGEIELVIKINKNTKNLREKIFWKKKLWKDPQYYQEPQHSEAIGGDSILYSRKFSFPC